MAAKSSSFRDLVRAFKQKPFWLAFLMGFSSGMPLFLTSRTLQVRLKDAQVDLTTIGIFSLVSLPYTLKFLWAPLLDRVNLSFLGLRRGWLFTSQFVLFLLILVMGALDPRNHLMLLGLTALLVSFFSATQDIVVDAYRIETLKDEELGLGTTLYMYGYKIALLITGGLALILADHISWQKIYFIMALVMALTMLITYFAEEPQIHGQRPQKLKEAVINPFLEFLRRDYAVVILFFILLYKIGDNMAGNMLAPFYLDRGYTKTEIGIIAKMISPTISWVGPILGGFLVYFFGILGALWIAGILQALSTFLFAVLALVPKNLWIYGAIVSFEDVTAAIGSIALVAFMSNMVNRRFSATQYALLSSLAQIPRVIIAAPTGFLAQHMGWSSYFVFCALAAIPGMLLISWLSKVSDGQSPEVVEKDKKSQVLENV